MVYRLCPKCKQPKHAKNSKFLGLIEGVLWFNCKSHGCGGTFTKIKSIAIVLALSACAHAPGYQPERARLGSVNVIGYKDTRLTGNTARVRYTHPDSNEAYRLFLRRAAEVTSLAGFQYFVVLDAKAGDEGIGGPWGMNASFPRHEGTIRMFKSEQQNSFTVADLLGAK